MKKIHESASEVISSLQWKDYFNDRMIAHHPSDFFVIIPKDHKDCPPVFCPVCGCSMSTADDLEAHSEVQCCSHCKEKWYYSNSTKWNEGWRPAKVECNYKKTIIVGE